MTNEDPLFLPQAVLLDRDGTIIEDRHYLKDPDEVSLLPGVAPALARLSRAGCGLYLVSNQSGLGRGYFQESDLLACQARLRTLLADQNVTLQDAVWCPHQPDDNCSCRKPRPGLWQRLSARHGLNARRCVMVGDKLVDVDFAVNAGLAAAFLVLTGYGHGEALRAGLPLPEADSVVEYGEDHGCRLFIARDLAAVVDMIGI